jgi:hypothetical protein
MHTHAHTCAHAHTHAHTHTHAHSHTHALTHTRTHSHTCTHTLTHAHSHTHSHTCTRTLTHTHTHKEIYPLYADRFKMSLKLPWPAAFPVNSYSQSPSIQTTGQYSSHNACAGSPHSMQGWVWKRCKKVDAHLHRITLAKRNLSFIAFYFIKKWCGTY